jgi:hypothetical protein
MFAFHVNSDGGGNAFRRRQCSVDEGEGVALVQ